MDSQVQCGLTHCQLKKLKLNLHQGTVPRFLRAIETVKCDVGSKDGTKRCIQHFVEWHSGEVNELLKPSGHTQVCLYKDLGKVRFWMRFIAVCGSCWMCFVVVVVVAGGDFEAVIWCLPIASSQNFICELGHLQSLHKNTWRSHSRSFVGAINLELQLHDGPSIEPKCPLPSVAWTSQIVNHCNRWAPETKRSAVPAPIVAVAIRLLLALLTWQVDTAMGQLMDSRIVSDVTHPKNELGRGWNLGRVSLELEKGPTPICMLFEVLLVCL